MVDDHALVRSPPCLYERLRALRELQAAPQELQRIRTRLEQLRFQLHIYLRINALVWQYRKQRSSNARRNEQEFPESA
jgi:hypothetical protein